MRIGILGAGRWGCTLATILCSDEHEVWLYCYDWEYERFQNGRIIPGTNGIPMNPHVKISDKMSDLEKCEVVILAFPGQYYCEGWEHYRDNIASTSVIANASKMIECDEDGKLVLPHDIIGQEYWSRYAHLLSAAFPEGLLNGSPACGTIYAFGWKLATRMQKIFPQDILRVYQSTDINGGALAGALKNVIAIASGIATAIGFDQGTIGSLISRAGREVKEFSTMIHGADINTFMPGSTFLADVFATSTSPNSHNFKAGIEIGNGVPVETLESSGGTIEGLHTLRTMSKVKGAFEMMPVTKAVYNIVYEQPHLHPYEAVKELMARPLKVE